MKFAYIILTLACAACASAQSFPPVTSEALQALIDLDELRGGAQQLQDFAYAYPDRNRVFGSSAHNDTVNFLAEVLRSTGFYNVEVQPFVELYSGGDSALTINGVPTNNTLFTYTPSGTATAPLVAVSNLGCATSDYPPQATGAIVLISRGNCTFAQKVTNAAAARALAAIVYNNIEGTIAGTLGGLGEYVPTVGTDLATGKSLLASLQNGTNLIATLEVNSVLENRTTFNVIAETKSGNHDSVLALGAHTDSVEAGPGINDDGSGTIGLLNVAIALSNFTVTNAVRFCFWSAEEFGLLGSTYYVTTLNETAPQELAKIRAYLNFDMIASPHYAYMIYDGDGSAFNLTGPAGSAEIESMFEDYYTAAGKTFNATAFDGRSDYGPFLDVGIAAGGIFTGAEEIKTDEGQDIWGGEEEIAYDVNYHQAGDNIFNLALDAFLLNTKLIAHSVATYATTFDSLPLPASLSRRHAREMKMRRDSYAGADIHGHFHHHCGTEDAEL
ncbi:Leucyl aminopeptidase yscIV [Neophaeococcomyces mojaviensis]|uniref:Leucyl aminopeptidase yscIV n=1 Tax=Neophaeococcomyces mojaviensis TaxID=3383035 RepID=A0ACC3ABM2_9EURO|nr:Leucyl aminopeptidase yscIV [Knufia sp. JES_112]